MHIGAQLAALALRGAPVESLLSITLETLPHDSTTRMIQLPGWNPQDTRPFASIWTVLPTIAELLGASCFIDLLTDRDYYTRHAASAVLATMREPVTTDLLLQTSRVGTTDARRLALQALATRGDTAAVPTLMKMLGDSDVDAEVARALGLLKDIRAVDALLTNIRMTRNEAEYAVALGRLGDPRAVPSLVWMLRSCWYSHARAEAARALGAIRDPAAVPPLVSALTEGPSDERLEVPAASAQSLGLIGDPAAIPGLRGALKEALPSLLDGGAQHNDRISVGKEVIWALGQLRDSASVETLVSILVGSKAYWVQAVAARSLGSIGERSAIPALSAVAADRNVHEDLKLAVIEALTKLGE